MFSILLLLIVAEDPALQQTGEPSPVLQIPFTRDVVNFLRFTDRDQSLEIGTLSGEFSTWGVRRQRRVSTVVMGREVRAYVPSSKGRVFTLHADGSVGLRTTETGEALRSFEFGDEGKYGKRRVLDIRPLANGRCLVVIHDARMVGGGEYVEIDPDRGTSPSPWRTAPVLCPGGKHYGVWLDKETIALLDSETRKRWRVIKVGTGWYAMVLSNDCSHLAVVNASPGTPDWEIRVFTTADG